MFEFWIQKISDISKIKHVAQGAGEGILEFLTPKWADFENYDVRQFSADNEGEKDDNYYDVKETFQILIFLQQIIFSILRYGAQLPHRYFSPCLSGIDLFIIIIHTGCFLTGTP